MASEETRVGDPFEEFQLRPGLSIISGFPRSGKTRLLLTMGRGAAQAGHSVLLCCDGPEFRGFEHQRVSCLVDLLHAEGLWDYRGPGKVLILVDDILPLAVAERPADRTISVQAQVREWADRLHLACRGTSAISVVATYTPSRPSFTWIVPALQNREEALNGKYPTYRLHRSTYSEGFRTVT